MHQRTKKWLKVAVLSSLVASAVMVGGTANAIALIPGNMDSGEQSVVTGGYENTASGRYSSITGGGPAMDQYGNINRWHRE